MKSTLKNNHIVILLLFAISFQSCKKYLGIDPDNRIRLETVEDYQDLVAGNYPELRHLFLELYTDNVKYYDYPDYNNVNINSWLKPFYLWSDSYIQNNAITPEAAWKHYYHVISVMNIVLEGIDSASGDPALRESVKGEALLVRSYSHFLLVNIFGKHYDEATASQDLGITYMLESEKDNIVTYKRQSVQYVYSQAERDALEGITLIQDEAVSQPQFHFTKASAHAYLARFYLYKGEFDKAYTHSQEVLRYNSSIRELIEDHRLFASGDYRNFADEYFSTSKQNILLMKRTLEWNSYYLNGFYANEFRATFHSSDYRGKIFTRTGGEAHPNYYVRKFRSLRTGGQQYSDVPLFSVEEAMITAMEAAIRKENSEPEIAIDLLNSLLVKRHNPFTELRLEDFSTKDELLERIIEERRKEFSFEGLRWFDIKRFDIPVTHWTENGEINLPAGDLRRVVQIPDAEFNANPDIQLNPR